jgi:hypothetical protein
MGLENVFGGEQHRWSLLQQRGLVVLVRHPTAPGFGDPPHFRLGDCATRRNLSEGGHRQARAPGEPFRHRNIPIEKAHTSR